MGLSPYAGTRFPVTSMLNASHGVGAAGMIAWEYAFGLSWQARRARIQTDMLRMDYYFCVNGLFYCEINIIFADELLLKTA